MELPGSVRPFLGEFIYADSAKFKEANSITLKDGEWSGELQHLTKDRDEVIVETRWSLLRDGYGRPKSIIVINTDVTEKRKIEIQFMRAQRMESLGILAGGIAHDLNNILTPIMLSIDVLKSMTVDGMPRSIVDTIEMSARRGSDIVHQVLSFARGMEGQRIVIQPKYLLKDIEHIINDTFPKDIRLQLLLPTIPGRFWGIPPRSSRSSSISASMPATPCPMAARFPSRPRMSLPTKTTSR